MNSFVDNLRDWTNKATDKFAVPIKETLNKLVNTSSITISDLATVILFHPDTKIEQNKYLDLVFNACHLSIGNSYLYLETKGYNHEHILECKVFRENRLLYQYKSYTGSTKLDDPIHLPEDVKPLFM